VLHGRVIGGRMCVVTAVCAGGVGFRREGKEKGNPTRIVVE